MLDTSEMRRIIMPSKNPKPKPYVRKLSADEDAPEDDARGPYTMEELQLMNDKFSSALAREHTDPWWRRRQR